MNKLTYFLMFFCVMAMAEDEPVCDENCTFVLKGEKVDDYKIVNAARSEERFSPFSTFKIANSLIALDLGVVQSLSQELTFDKSSYPVQEWWPKIWYKSPLTLKEAFQHSAVPIYQQLASQIGNDDMWKYVSNFSYGNADISSGVDNFWLNGSIKITAREQVEFLQRLHRRELPVAESSITQLKEIMLVETTDKYKLYAKTGGGYLADNRTLGWYTGFVERGSDVHYFSMNIETASFEEINEKRMKIVRKILKDENVL